MVLVVEVGMVLVGEVLVKVRLVMVVVVTNVLRAWLRVSFGGGKMARERNKRERSDLWWW